MSRLLLCGAGRYRRAPVCQPLVDSRPRSPGFGQSCAPPAGGIDCPDVFTYLGSDAAAAAGGAGGARG